MIDIDKYENHDMIRIAKQLLIEDAPLLLEEVKRLRERLRILNGMNNALWNTVENYDICLDDFTMIDLLNPPKGYEFCEDEERWVKKNEMD